MPVERRSTSIHSSSVKARRPWNNSSMSMLGIWIGFKSWRTNGDPFWSSSKKYWRVMMHQMPPTSSFSNFLTMPLSTSTPLTPRFDSSASYTSRRSLSETVTLSMILRLPRSRISDLTFSASSGRT